MVNAIQSYMAYLHNVKKASDNTEASYRRDLLKAADFFATQQIEEPGSVTSEGLNSYILFLEGQNLSAATVSRNMAALRSFFRYLYKEKQISENPAVGVKSPKVVRKAPTVLSEMEIDLLLSQPDRTTAKGIRDKAMLELLYATGLRVSELIHLKLSCVNLQLGFLVSEEGEKARTVPFGDTAKEALVAYILHSRPALLKEKESELLFLNCSGNPMSRQGFWKVMKTYAAAAGITKEITPHTIRHSFAYHLIRNGADLKSVQEMMGHADIMTTQVYVNTDLYRMQSVYRKTHPRK